MTATKNTQSGTKVPTGKGSLNEAKTNEDFNKRKPENGDPQLKVKKVKK